MEDERRALWTDLIADLEEDCRSAPPPPPPPPLPRPRREPALQANGGNGGGDEAPRFPRRSHRHGRTRTRRGRFPNDGARSAASWQRQAAPPRVVGDDIPTHVLTTASASGRRHHHEARGGGGESPVESDRKQPPEAKAPPLITPLIALGTASLRGWIDHCKDLFKGPDASLLPPSVTRPGVSWRSRVGGAGHFNKGYLEQAAKVALSLAYKLEKDPRAIQERDIVTMNVFVINTRTGESDFILTRDDSKCESERNQRRKIYALGKIFYEIFTRGKLPPLQDKAKDNPKQPEPSPQQLSHEGGDYDAYDQQARPQRRRREDRGAGVGARQSVESSLRVEGLPASVCHLISDMMDNELFDQGMCRDTAVTSFQDVVSDLGQMVSDPGEFLHDSLPARWRPRIKDKLYFREEELGRALEVATRVSSRGTEMDGSAEGGSHQVLMVSGHSGTGKSHFVRELCDILGKRGWRSFHCKFDSVNARPLSFIISAFERYFSDLLRASSNRADVDNTGDEELNEIRNRIRKSFVQDHRSALFHLIPATRPFISESHEDPPRNDEDAGPHDRGLKYVNCETFRCRLHLLFSMLLRVIASWRPVLLFLDDLHWADQASLDLIVALVDQQAAQGGGSRCTSSPQVLFVGSYRENERTETLDASLRQVASIEGVTLSKIPLDGLSGDHVEAMVSEALSYPRRLARPLSRLIHEKSAGNPLFIKEFLNDLAAENLLNYSLSSRIWEWDESLIQARTVSDSVAELLTRRLHRLPAESVIALQVLSIFGSQVPMHVLVHVRDVCGIANIVAELDLPSREGLVKISAETCSFVHDMIQHAVRVGIGPDEGTGMLREVSRTLLSRRADGRRPDAELFILVDLINRLGPDEATPVDCIRYASLNLLAGEKAIQTPDYCAACNYFESGISYLEEDRWASSYNLSLALSKNAAYAQHAKGQSDLMMERINEVLDNARTFDEKLDSYHVMIQSLALDASNVSKASEQSFIVLRQLGECFPAIPDKDTILKELLDVKTLLEQYVPSSLSKIPPMDNIQKINAMTFFPTLLQACYQQKSPFLPLVASRMVKITIQHGLHEKSAWGFCFYALAFATVFKDNSEAYRLGKYALAVTNNKNMVMVYYGLYGVINIWKEPLQAILPELLKAYQVGMEDKSGGNIYAALINTNLYTYRAFFSGTKMSSLREEIISFIRLYSLYKRHTLRISVMPIFNTISLLVGCSHPVVQKNTVVNEDDDEILAKSFKVKELTVSESVVVCKMMRSFILRDMDDAAKVARQYLDFFEEHDRGPLLFINIYRYFYGGLIAFDRYRSSLESYWLEIGLRSMARLEKWAEECEWNFQNKMLLLQAEHRFATGDIEKAESLYNLAISSSRDHRFIHEQALSCELAYFFHCAIGRINQSSQLLKQAVQCYTQWGAHEKANALALSFV